jgi:hypothetical protein
VAGFFLGEVACGGTKSIRILGFVNFNVHDSDVITM